MQISPLLILGAIGIGYALTSSKKSYPTKIDYKSPSKKFSGYYIKDELLIVTDAKKLKDFVFNIGKTKPEGELFKDVFGYNYVTFSDVTKGTYGSNTNLIVKDKAQQDNIYVLLSYLFAGAYIQSPHRVGAYADQLNNYVSYVKKMFNIDYPVLKSIDQAKLFFEELADKMN